MRNHQNLIASTVAAFVIVPLAILFSAVITAGRDTASGGAAGGDGSAIQIELGDLFVKPSKINVTPGQKVKLVVTNNGSVPHDLKVNGTEGTEMLAPGKSQTIEVGPLEATTQAWCTVPGHKQAGMVLTMEVAGAAASTGGTHAMTTMAQNSNNAVIDPNATPAAGWKPFDPALKPAPGGTEHKITLTAEETIIEVAPGVKQQMFTFNEQFPGPVLRGKIGDIFTITLVNKGTMGHSIDFHASKVAWNDEMRTINPGESLVYQFEAKFSGAFMYHCGTAPVAAHIANGMYGALLVDPATPRPSAREFVLVQSEFYLGPKAGPDSVQSLDWQRMLDLAPDYVTFNGVASQYATHPLQVAVGEPVRFYVVNAGPNRVSSFHVVGAVFDRVYLDGFGTPLRGVQTFEVPVGGGMIFDVRLGEEGIYPFVSHAFADATKGAVGMLRAGNPPGSASH